MRLFFVLFVVTLLAPIAVSGQHITDKKGKTFYDEEQTQLKEVYSYKQVTVLSPRTSESQSKKQVRHGPYFYYYKDGDIKVSGRYKDGERQGKWEHYSEDGTLRKVVRYKAGKQTNINKDPKQPEDRPDGAED